MTAPVQLPERVDHLLGRGCRIIPLHWASNEGTCSCRKPDCPSTAKHPIHDDWEKLASSDRGTVLQWARYYPLCNWGWVQGDEYITLDLDRKRGEDGIASLRELEAKHGQLPRDCIATTPSGGHHLILRNPNGARFKAATGWRPGIDIRAGNSQIVIEPSVTPNGSYRFDRFGIPGLAPDWLLELLPPQGDETQTEADFVLDENAELPERAQQLLDSEPKQAWFNAAFRHEVRKPGDTTDSGWDCKVLREYLRRYPDATNQELCDLLCAHRASANGGGWDAHPKRLDYATRTIAAARKDAPPPHREADEPESEAEAPPTAKPPPITRQPKIEVLSARQICELPDPPESDRLIGDLVVRRQRLILGAHTGHGKTSLVGQVIKISVQGGDFLSWTCGGNLRALVIDAEQGLRSIKRQLRAWDLDKSDQVDYVRVPDGLSLDQDQAQVDAIEAILDRGRYDIVSADPLYKLHRGDSNDERSATDLMRTLDRWREEYGFASILQGHCRKPPIGSKFTMHEFFGSTAYLRGAEVVIGLQFLRSGHSRLYFFKDRDGDLPVGTTLGLLYDKETGFRVDPNAGKPQETSIDVIKRLLTDDPGLNLQQLMEASKYAERTVRAALKKLDAEEKSGLNNAKQWFLPLEEDEPE